MLTADRTRGRRFRDLGPVLKTTVAPTFEPVTVEQLKRQCDVIDGGERDADFEQWIKAAREVVESDSRRALVTQTRKLYLDDFPSQSGSPSGQIELECPPIQSVASVAYYDEANVLQTLDGARWAVDVNSEPGIVYPVYGQFWPTVRPQRKGAVIVTFVAGWADRALVPAAGRQAILLLAGFWYRYREAAGEEKVNTRPLGYDDLVRRIKWGPDA